MPVGLPVNARRDTPRGGAPAPILHAIVSGYFVVVNRGREVFNLQFVEGFAVVHLREGPTLGVRVR